MIEEKRNQNIKRLYIYFLPFKKFKL